MRAAAPELRPTSVNDLALTTVEYYAADLSYSALDVGLSSALFGAFCLSDRSSTWSRLKANSMLGVLTLLVIVTIVFLA